MGEQGSEVVGCWSVCLSLHTLPALWAGDGTEWGNVLSDFLEMGKAELVAAIGLASRFISQTCDLWGALPLSDVEPGTQVLSHSRAGEEWSEDFL